MSLPFQRRMRDRSRAVRGHGHRVKVLPDELPTRRQHQRPSRMQQVTMGGTCRTSGFPRLRLGVLPEQGES